MWVIIIIMIIIFMANLFYKKEQEREYTPLEKELDGIKPGADGRAKKIAMYVVPLYKKPYVEMGSPLSSASIGTIVSKYIDNQLLFSEKYNDHVIDISGIVVTIGKEGEEVYISIGDGEYYVRSGASGGESVREHIECFIDKVDMEDAEYKKIITDMRPGASVTLVGVLRIKKEYDRFELRGTTVIEADGNVPGRIMNIAVNSIYKKFGTEE